MTNESESGEFGLIRPRLTANQITVPESHHPSTETNRSYHFYITLSSSEIFTQSYNLNRLHGRVVKGVGHLDHV